MACGQRLRVPTDSDSLLEVTRAAARPDALCGRVFCGSQSVAMGLLTPRQLQSSAWARLLRDVYADARLPDTHARAIAGARLVMPANAVVAGRSAACLYGARDLIDGSQPVEVLVATTHRFGPVAGLDIRSVRHLPPTDLTTVGVTALTRTLADLAVWAPDIVEAVSLADGRAESPPESRLRVRLVLAGLPRPEPQFVMRRAGRFVARVDLAYPEHALAIEYLGAWHDETGQFAGDRRRLNRLVAAGWRSVHDCRRHGRPG